MATRTISAAGGNSNVAATYDENAVPGAGDDIVARADGTSGNFVIAATLSCRSFNLTTSSVSGGTYSGAITRTGGNLQIGTTTAPPSGIAFAIPGTVNWNVAGTVVFLTTHTTAQLVYLNSKTVNGPFSVTGTNALIVSADVFTSTSTLTVNGSGATLRLDANMTVSTTALTQGTLNINGFTLTQTSTSGGFQINGATTKVLAMGSGGIIIVPRTTLAFNATGASNITTSGTGTFRCTSTGQITITLNGVNLSAVTFESTLATQGMTFNDSGTVGGVTRTNVAGNKSVELIFTSNLTISGALTVTGADVASHILIKTPTRGTQVTLTVNGSVSIDKADIRDIVGAGSASWNVSSSRVGDSLGNSGITFPSGTTQTWTGGTGNWSDVSHWTSRVPLPQDDVYISGSATITVDSFRLCKLIDFTGFTGTWSPASNNDMITYGNLILSATMTLLGTGRDWTFAGRSSHTITTNGLAFGPSFTLDAVGGTYSLQDAFSTPKSTTIAIQIISGTFDANDFNVTFTGSGAGFTMTGGTVLMGNGTWTFTGTSTRSFWIVTGGTVTCEGSLILAPSGTGGAYTFAGGGKTYNRLERAASSAGSLLITGANVFSTLSHTGGTTPTLSLPSSVTTTITGTLRLQDNVSVISSTAGVPATISAAGGVTVEVENVSIKDSTGSGGATFVAYNSTNVSGNTGWTFSTKTYTKDAWGMIPMGAVIS